MYVIIYFSMKPYNHARSIIFCMLNTFWREQIENCFKNNACNQIRNLRIMYNSLATWELLSSVTDPFAWHVPALCGQSGVKFAHSGTCNRIKLGPTETHKRLCNQKNLGILLKSHQEPGILTLLLLLAQHVLCST